MLQRAVAIGLGCMMAVPLFCAEPVNEIELAFTRLYNFDFPGAHAALDRHIASHPDDPMGYAMRASANLFYELDRLSILESEFFSDDRRIADKKRPKPDPVIRASLLKSVDQAQSLAQAMLAKNPNDEHALFSLCVTVGVLSDYTALVEKKQISSLSLVKRSTAYAQRLLKVNPNYYDAYLTTGTAEYLIGSLPFFVRWFVHVDNITPSKEQGQKTVRLVAEKGHYLRPMAKILLAIAALRDKRPRDAEALLAALTNEFPENPLFKKELAQISAKMQSGRAGE